MGSVCGYAAEQLNGFGLVYLHVVEPRVKGNNTSDADAPPVATCELRHIFNGPIIAAGGFIGASAEAIVSAADANLVAFGRHFIANPDLARRLRKDLPLNPYDRSTFYGGNSRGYTDYPPVGCEKAAA